MTTSILEIPYVPANRPYSQNELQDMQISLYKQLKLGDVYVHHKNCNHFYLTRKNGVKEKKILEDPNVETNCSVCFCLNKTPRHLLDTAYNVCEEYFKRFDKNNPNKLTYNMVELENVFYKYLYQDFKNYTDIKQKKFYNRKEEN
jgi:hypothetical protein